MRGEENEEKIIGNSENANKEGNLEEKGKQETKGKEMKGKK